MFAEGSRRIGWDERRDVVGMTWYRVGLVNRSVVTPGMALTPDALRPIYLQRCAHKAGRLSFRAGIVSATRNRDTIAALRPIAFAKPTQPLPQSPFESLLRPRRGPARG